MDYTYRLIDKNEDFELLSEWNDEYGIGTMELEDYPCTAFVVLTDFGETIMCHIFITGTGVGFVMFHKNPKEKAQGRSFEHAIDFATKMARRKGLKKLLTSTSSFNRKTLTRLGFRELKKTGYLMKKL